MKNIFTSMLMHKTTEILWFQTLTFWDNCIAYKTGRRTITFSERIMNPSLPDAMISMLKKIRSQVIEKKGSQANLAFDVGRHHSYVSEVLNGYRFLDEEERKIWGKELEIDPNDFPIPIYRVYERGKNRQLIGWAN